MSSTQSIAAGTTVEFSPDELSVRVDGVTLSAYTGYQHPWLSTTSLSRLGVHCRRAAFDAGWLSTTDPEGNRTSSIFSMWMDRSRFARVQQEQSPSHTVFLVAMNVELADAGSNPIAISQVDVGFAELFVVSVGKSSFGLGGRFYRRERGDSAASPTRLTLLGTVQINYVYVDWSTRRSSPLPEALREALEGASQKTSTDAESGAVPLTRLPAESLLRSLLWSADDSDGIRFQRSFTLRVADFDFNLHLNQSMYAQFALDALKEGFQNWLFSDDQRRRPEAKSLQRWILQRMVQSSSESLTDESDAAALMTIEGQSPKVKRAVLRWLLQVDSWVSAMKIEFLKEVPLPDWSCLQIPSIEVRIVPQIGINAEFEGEFFFGVFGAGSIPSAHCIGVLRLA